MTDRHDVTQVLRIEQSRGKLMYAFAASAIFSLLGALMAIAGVAGGDIGGLVMGLALLLLLGGVSFSVARNLFFQVHRQSLTLSPEGISYTHGGTLSAAWNDVHSIREYRPSAYPLVQLKLTPPGAERNFRQRLSAKRFAWAPDQLSAIDDFITVPTAGFSMSHVEILGLITAYFEAHGGREAGAKAQETTAA